MNEITMSDGLIESSRQTVEIAEDDLEILDALPEQFEKGDIQILTRMELCDDHGPYSPITNYTGEIVFAGGAESTLGRVSMRYVELDDTEESVFDILDCVDSATAEHLVLFKETGEFTSAMAKHLEYPDIGYRNLLLFDRIEILPEARGRGLAQLVVDLLIRKVGRGARAAVLKPFPLQHSAKSSEREGEWSVRMAYDQLPKSYEASLKRLKGVYAKMGFACVRGTKYMVRDIGI